MLLEIITLLPFRDWLDDLRDRRAKTIIAARLRRAAEGNLGQTRALGPGLNEMKIDFGPGYRLYYSRVGDRIVVVLCGGDKSSQGRDIERAAEILKHWQEFQDGS